MRTVEGRTDHVVVVGAGLSGLSAALHLAGRGRAVTVVERGDRPRRPGRAGRHRRLPPRHRTDGADHARHHRRGLRRGRRIPVRPPRAAAGAPGLPRAVRRRQRAGRAHRARRRWPPRSNGSPAPGRPTGYLRLRGWLTELYRTEFDGFIGANFDSPLSLLTPQLARLAALGGFRRWDKVVRRFLTDERLRRVFTFQALYAGVPPQSALAVYAVIAYMDTIAGVYFPRGGMRALPDAMAAAAADAGVEFIYGSTVSELEWSGVQGHRGAYRRRAIGHRRRRRGADHRTARHLSAAGPHPAPAAAAAPGAVGRRRPRRVPQRSPMESAHHTILFGDAWDQTFRDIIDDGRVMGDPSLLVTRPTASDPTPGAARSRPALRSGAGAEYRSGHSGLGCQLVGATSTQMLGTVTDRLPQLGDDAELLSGGDTRRLGPPGHGGGHPVRVGAHVRPDRTVPAGQHRARRRQRGAGRLVDGARRGRTHRADVRPAGRRPDHRSARTTRLESRGVPTMIGSELDAAGVRDPALRDAYRQCREINAAHGKTFFLATRLLAPGQRPAVHALYGFARRADDILDDFDPPAAPSSAPSSSSVLSTQLFNRWCRIRRAATTRR